MEKEQDECLSLPSTTTGSHWNAANRSTEAPVSQRQDTVVKLSASSL